MLISERTWLAFMLTSMYKGSSRCDPSHNLHLPRSQLVLMRDHHNFNTSYYSNNPILISIESETSSASYSSYQRISIRHLSNPSSTLPPPSIPLHSNPPPVCSPPANLTSCMNTPSFSLTSMVHVHSLIRLIRCPASAATCTMNRYFYQST
jgi:hypothetical protein